jgi:hypothetical protein
MDNSLVIKRGWESSNEWMLWENQLEMVEGNAPTGENTTHRNQRPFCATSHFWFN